MQLQRRLNALKKSQNASSSSSSSSSSTSSNRRTSVSGVASLSATTFLETTRRLRRRGSQTICVWWGERRWWHWPHKSYIYAKRAKLVWWKYENLQIHHQSLKKKHDTTVDRLGKFKGTYNDLRRHCYLIEEDKKSLYEHSKWQEGHIDLLQRHARIAHMQHQKPDLDWTIKEREYNITGNCRWEDYDRRCESTGNAEALQQKMNVLKEAKTKHMVWF